MSRFLTVIATIELADGRPLGTMLRELREAGAQPGALALTAPDVHGYLDTRRANPKRELNITNELGIKIRSMPELAGLGPNGEDVVIFVAGPSISALLVKTEGP